MTSRRFFSRWLLTALVVTALFEGGARLAMAAADPVVLRWHDHTAQLKIQQMETRGEVDVVVIGTSMAQQDLIPGELLGRLPEIGSVYNAALNAGVPEVMESWLLDQVEPRLAPDVVVWGLSALDFSSVYGDAVVQAYERAPATADGVLGALDRNGSELSELVRNRRVLRSPSAIFGPEQERIAEARDGALAVLGADGERRDFTAVDDEARRAEVAGRITPFELDRDDVAAIIRTVGVLRDRGVEVVFVELPTPRRFRALFPAGPEQQRVVAEALTGLSDELDVPLITLDMAAGSSVAPGPFRDGEFVDFTHLNAEGAIRFSRQIGDQLDLVLG